LVDNPVSAYKALFRHFVACWINCIGLLFKIECEGILGGILMLSRIYPEAKTGMIKWIEDNFHEIDSFVSTFSLKDGTTMTIYDAHSFLEAMGILGVATSTISDLANNEMFIPKKQ
jgi:hypothetical protein